jgi:hypothetical protein
LAALIAGLTDGGSQAIWWWPAGTIALTFAGFMLGWMFEQEVEGERMDNQDAQEAGRVLDNPPTEKGSW